MNKNSIMFLILFLGIFLEPFAITGFPVNLTMSHKSPAKNLNTSQNKLHFSFILHANQASVPYSDVANDLNYYYVLLTLLKHPDIPVTLHFSGTWLTTMEWYNSSTIDLIKQGIASGQFEILGSTYAQNIIYNTNNWDNYYQIQQHKQVIYDILGVTPIGFWNPERVWQQSQYVPLITNAGYEYTFVEDHIIQNSTDYSGSPEFLIRNVTRDNKNLLIVDDDKGIISVIDPIAPTTSTALPLNTRIDNAINYLKGIYTNDTNGDYLVSYGQDMEAWGLWQSERGIATTQQVMTNLDTFLSRLTNESSWLTVVHPNDFINQLKSSNYKFENINKIDFGEAQWMTDAAKNDGYSSWLQWVSSDLDLQIYNQSFNQARNYLQTIESNIINSKNNGLNTSAAEKIFTYAIRVFIANEYEYGCYGCKFSWFNRAKVSMIPSYAVTFAINRPITNIVQEKDLDGDDLAEYLMVTRNEFYVFTKIGGRLIFACNLVSGDIFIGGDDTATYTSKGVDYSQPYSYQEYTYPITKADQWNRGLGKVYRIHQKVFNDQIGLNILANNYYIYNISNNQITFIYNTSNYKIEKNFSFNQDKIITTYFVTNLQASNLTYSLDLALAPFYIDLQTQELGLISKTNSSIVSGNSTFNWIVNMYDSTQNQKFNITGSSNVKFNVTQPYNELFGYHIIMGFDISTNQIANFQIVLNLNGTGKNSQIILFNSSTPNVHSTSTNISSQKTTLNINPSTPGFPFFLALSEFVILSIITIFNRFRIKKI